MHERFHNAALIVQPLPAVFGILIGSVSGLLPPASWSLAVQCLAAVPTSMVVSMVVQTGWGHWSVRRSPSLRPRPCGHRRLCHVAFDRCGTG